MRVGRPRKQQPHRPGAPEPIPAAGCGPERHLTVAEPKRSGNGLRLTPTGWMPDLLGTWHNRKQKRDPKRPGRVETVINDRQCLAGREIEYMIGVIAGQESGQIKSFDLTVPVVDQSFRHRLGPVDQKRLDEGKKAERLRKHLGKRDFDFLVNVLFGMGVHGAMLHEAGLTWRPDDPAAQAAINDYCAGGGGMLAGTLAGPHAYRIDRDADSFNPERQKRGGFEVHDRREREALGHAGKIGRGKQHMMPNDPWFVVDQATEIENTARAAVHRKVSDSRQDARREARLDELEDIGNAKDAVSKDRRDQLDELLLKETLKQRPLHVRDADKSIGSTVDFEEVLRADQTNRERAIEAFGMRKIELASLRVRDLLSKAADFFEKKATETEPEPTSTPAKISQGSDIPFDVGTFEDAIFTELEPVAVKAA
jgi:hypothetical protein